MPLVKKAPAKKAAAKKGPAPKAAAPKRTTKTTVVEDDEDEEVEEEETDTEDMSVEVGEGALKVMVRRSVSATYADGVLDNWVAEVTVEIPEGTSADDMQAEINRASVAAAFAIGAPYVGTASGGIAVGLPTYNGTPTKNYGKSSGGDSAGAAKKMGAKAPAKGRSGGGGNSNTGSYSDADKKALWARFAEDVEANDNEFPEDGWFDNTTSDFPNVKPKNSTLEDLEIEAEAKPLYLKNAPKAIKEMFEEE